MGRDEGQRLATSGTRSGATIPKSIGGADHRIEAQSGIRPWASRFAVASSPCRATPSDITGIKHSVKASGGMRAWRISARPRARSLVKAAGWRIQGLSD